MFETKYEKCSNDNFHYSHNWYPHWWSKTRICTGVKFDDLDPWCRANPAIGVRINAQRALMGYESHRHYYLVKNNVLVTPVGFPVSTDNVYWQCADPFCGDIVTMSREEVREVLLHKRHPINQTWPG